MVPLARFTPSGQCADGVSANDSMIKSISGLKDTYFCRARFQCPSQAPNMVTSGSKKTNIAIAKC